jgi:hypothetical protein
MQVLDRPGRALFPMSQTDFFTKVNNDQIFSFERDADGSVTAVTVTRTGRGSQRAKRL